MAGYQSIPKFCISFLYLFVYNYFLSGDGKSVEAAEPP